MLTATHLAVLRAALQYFREELGPHGPDAWQPYLPDNTGAGITADTLAELQQLLADCQLAYGDVDPQTLRMSDPQLQFKMSTGKAATGHHELAAVLWPRTTDH